MPLTVYTGLCAPIVKFKGATDVAPGFAKRIVVVADSSSAALKRMANFFRTYEFPPVPDENDKPEFAGMEVFGFERGATDGDEGGQVVVLQ
jgi:hypothetical protein